MNSIQTNTPEDIEEMFATAPKVFTAAVRGWLISERNSFVATSKNDGDFPNELMAKQRKYRPGYWSPYMARAFRGRVQNGKDLSKMTLTMGVNKGRLKKMPYLESLGSGANIRAKNSQWLIIPVYKNLIGSTIGLFGRHGGRGKRSFINVFKQMRGNLTTYYRNGKALFFGDMDDPELMSGGSALERHRARHLYGLNRKLLFIGVRSVDIPKQFDFEGAWKTRLPAVMARGQLSLIQAVEKIESGGVAYDKF